MKKNLLLVLLVTISTAGSAQSLIRLQSVNGVSEQFTAVNEPVHINFNPAGAKALFGLQPTSNLVLTKTESDRLGFVHYRYYQSYQDIPIEKTMFIVHTKNGLIRSMSGTIVTEFDPAMGKRAVASITSSKAIDIAIANVHAKIYAWQDAGMQHRIQEQTGNSKASYYPRAERVFYNPGQTLSPRELHLCYKIDVYALQPLSRAYYFVDAQTGNVIGKQDRIFYTDVTGTANTAWSGTQAIHSDKTGANSFRLRDYSRGNGVITLHGEFGERGQDYTSTSANWTLTGYDQAAMDAHYGVEQTYSFYMTIFGRNSYDNSGTALYSYVNDPTYIDNAFWDGSAMNYNMRSNGDKGGVTGIDVTGHELTHGVTQETCNLDYSFESGAINESLSDIMGKSVQFWAKPDDIDWRLSNDMNWIIRDMSAPNARFQPDTYKGSYWYYGFDDNGGVHTNSGVGNFMFYLLVNGGSGTNDKGNAYNVSPIGLAKSEQIIYRSQTVYLTQTSNYLDWRNACISAAVDLFGSNSGEVSEVKNAFYAVGIGTDASGCDAPTGLNATSITKNSATLVWSPVGGAKAYNLQWRLSTFGTWTTVSNLDTNRYDLTGLTAGFSYDFRVQTKCTDTTSSVFSGAYTFSTLSSNGGSYCASSGQSTSYEYIRRVAIGSKGYTSGNNNGYGNFTSLVAPLTAGSQYTIQLTPGFITSTYSEYWTAYIDYNQDGDFVDSKERIGTVVSTSKDPVNLTFTVPGPALSGNTRLRIQMTYNSQVTDPCAKFSYGEVEDYTVKIKGGTVAIAATAETRSNTLSVMPNPVRGNSVAAILYLAKAGDLKISITDLSDRILSDQAIHANRGKNTFALSGVSGLKNGVFMIVAEQDGIIVARAQIIVDR